MSDLHAVDQDPASAEFQRAWHFARAHLAKSGGEVIAWVRWLLQPPLAEHLAFRFGNQLVFVYVEPDRASPPSSRELFLAGAHRARAVACLMPMSQSGAGYVTTRGGWGLLEVQTGRLYDPTLEVSDELIEISDWEVHDIALQTVRNRLEEESAEILSWQPSPDIDPSLWFARQGQRFWVCVRGYRFPETQAQRPANLHSLRRRLSAHAAGGFYAQVGVAAYDQTASKGGVMPVYRGHGMTLRYSGLTPI